MSTFEDLTVQTAVFAILELAFLYIVAFIFGEIASRSLPFVQQSLENRRKTRTDTDNVNNNNNNNNNNNATNNDNNNKTNSPNSYIRLPPLLGMLIAGVLIANISNNFLLQHIPSSWSFFLRKTALTVILVRAGLGLDIIALRAKSATTLRLSFIPCLTEALSVTLLIRLFDPSINWAFSITLGFVLSAVSPAVVVPSLLELQEMKYGTLKGIPSMILAAASLDDVFAICGFGVAMSIAFSSGNGSIIRAAIDGPINIFGGIFIGCIIGWLLGNISYNINDNNKIFIKSITLIIISLIIVFISSEFGYAGGGYLSTMICACICAQYWNKNITNGVSKICKKIWYFMQIALFMLIGAQIKLFIINGKDLAIIIIILCVSLSIRLCVTFLISAGHDLNIKERMFIAVAWFPKATVQAAIGSTVLDRAIYEQRNSYFINIGQFILIAAVLSIIISAPIGAIGIYVCGPKWLEKEQENVDKNDKNDKNDSVATDIQMDIKMGIQMDINIAQKTRVMSSSEFQSD